jgi:hypothetical protein
LCSRRLDGTEAAGSSAAPAISGDIAGPVPSQAATQTARTVSLTATGGTPRCRRFAASGPGRDTEPAEFGDEQTPPAQIDGEVVDPATDPPDAIFPSRTE